MSNFVILNPKPELNEHAVMPPATLRVYESSQSKGNAPLVTLTMVEPDGTLAGGTRLDRSQMLALADALLDVAGFATLEEIRDEQHEFGYEAGFRDGEGEGFERGYDLGFERGLDAGYDLVNEEIA